MKIIYNEFLEELKNITCLSEKVNGKDKRKIFEMIKNHSGEIEGLYNEKDEHWSVETADLIVLCFELLLSEGKNVDLVFGKCLPRFYTKLNDLAKDV